jgi:hypothetical protein
MARAKAEQLHRAPLQRKWFFEQRDGNCRLTSKLVVELSETSRIWRRALGPLAEWVAHTLWSTTSKPSKSRFPATRLTQRRKREAKGIPTATLIAPLATPFDLSQNHVPMASVESSRPAARFARLNRFDAIAQERRAESQRRQAAARKT